VSANVAVMNEGGGWGPGEGKSDLPRVAKAREKRVSHVHGLKRVQWGSTKAIAAAEGEAKINTIL